MTVRQYAEKINEFHQINKAAIENGVTLSLVISMCKSVYGAILREAENDLEISVTEMGLLKDLANKAMVECCEIHK